jgi:diaminopimelate epimerase
MKTTFTKMTGAGNDFVVIDNREKKIKSGSVLARRLCDRRWGIGADGLLLLENSRRAAYRMMYYNADGSYGGMCGNGGRCIALFAVQNGIAKRVHDFEALDHVYHAWVRKDSVCLRMKDPSDLQLRKTLRLRTQTIELSYIDTGAPHVVVLTKDVRGAHTSLKELDVIGLGREIRYHPAFGRKGTNVNFVERVAAKSLAMRTYERGVEDETLACGTGSIAAAIVCSMLWNLHAPITILARSGKRLVVEFTVQRGVFSEIRLKGPAEETFRGIADLKGR